MNRYSKRTLACVLAATVAIGSMSIAGNVSAAKAVKLSKTKLSLKEGDKAVIKLNNGNKKAKVTWKTSKKSVAKLTKKVAAGQKASATVVAVKKGSAKITASYKLAGKHKKLVATVKVSEKNSKPVASAVAATTVPVIVATNSPSTAPTQVPVTPTAAVTTAPTSVPPTESPAAKPTPEIIKASEAKISQDIPADYSAKKSDVTYGEFKRISYPSEVTNTNRDADVFLPADYDKDKTYPVLYMLHGIGGGGNRYGDGNGLLARMIGNAIASGICPEVIVVAPNMRCTTLGETDNKSQANDKTLLMHTVENYKYYDLFIDDIRTGLMPYMEENFLIKTGRENTAIAGFSMGGRESLYIGVSHPELFGYIGAFCPAFGIFEYFNSDVSMGEDGLFTEDTFTLPDEYKNNTYVQIVKGTYDGVVHDEPLKYHNALKANGVDHIFYEYGGGHDEKVWGHGFYNFMCNVFQYK